MNNQRWIIALVAVVVLAVGGWFIFAKAGSSSPAASPSPSVMASMSMAPQPSSSSSSSAATDTSSVTISNYAFSPSAITVKKGTKVTWTNQDSVGHTVTETDGQTGPNSSTFNQGQSYSFTYNTAGTFHYKCTVHPYMTGTVTVTD